MALSWRCDGAGWATAATGLPAPASTLLAPCQRLSHALACPLAAMPWPAPPAAVKDFDQRQVFRARDNGAYPHEYDISTTNW